MRIGILADSHGRTESTRRAVAALTGRGADLLIHLGDLETEAVLDELTGVKTRIVFGNCDWDARALARHARRLGIEVDDDVGRIEIDGKRIVFTHGHIRRVMSAALAEGVEYLLHGHTHELRDERIGPTRVINPGALFRASRYTAVVLDPRIDQLEVIDVRDATGPGK